MKQFEAILMTNLDKPNLNSHIYSKECIDKLFNFKKKLTDIPLCYPVEEYSGVIDPASIIGKVDLINDYPNIVGDIQIFNDKLLPPEFNIVWCGTTKHGLNQTIEDFKISYCFIANNSAYQVPKIKLEEINETGMEEDK